VIWHFFEVWALMLVAFAIGCPIGALAYSLIAGSPLAGLQGDFADVVGDVIDGIKSRLGIGPVWRPEYRRLVERSAHDTRDIDDHGGHRIEGPGRQARLPAGSGVLMIVDRSDRADREMDEDDLADAVASAAGSYDAGEAGSGEGPQMARPVALAAPRNGVPDDLQRIRGVGRRIEQRLNVLGIYHFGQIAAWTPAEIRWVAHQLAFPDRIERDDWVGQAIVLAAGGSTGFVKSADRRRARRWQEAFPEAPLQRPGADDAEDIAGEEAGDDEDSGETPADTLQAIAEEAPDATPDEVGGLGLDSAQKAGGAAADQTADDDDSAQAAAKAKVGDKADPEEETA
jgi:predicted flap endonuclease-1-like 5' DNA nuclease